MAIETALDPTVKVEGTDTPIAESPHVAPVANMLNLRNGSTIPHSPDDNAAGTGDVGGFLASVADYQREVGRDAALVQTTSTPHHALGKRSSDDLDEFDDQRQYKRRMLAQGQSVQS